MWRWRAVLTVIGVLALAGGTLTGPDLAGASVRAGHLAQAAEAFGSGGSSETGTRTLFREDFEGLSQGATAQPLREDRGGGGVSESYRGGVYSADLEWLDTSLCNGIVLGGDAQAELFGCDAGAVTDWMAPYVSALGAKSGLGSMNHALASATSGKTGSGKILGTGAIAGTSGRFLWVAADVAGDARIGDSGCTLTRSNAPAYTFELRSGSDTAIFGAGGQTVCNGVNGSSSPDNRAVSTLVPSNGTALYWPHGDAALDIRNETATADGQGDDGAIDNIRIVDVTPTLSMRFADADLRAGDTAVLHITVSNTRNPLDGLDAKSGWGFEVAPQAGLEMVGAPSENTCGGTTRTVGGGLQLSDGTLPQGSPTCTIAVRVKQLSSEDPGVSKNYGVSLSHADGVDAQNPSAKVTFTDAVAPTVPTLQPSNGRTVAGTAEKGATVTVSTAEGKALGSATAGPDGTFTVTLPSAQTDGTTLLVGAADHDQNASAPTGLTVSGAPPRAPRDVMMVDSVASGTAQPGALVFVVDADGRTLGQATADAAGRFRLNAQAGPGSTVSMIAQDMAGNRSEPVMWRVGPAVGKVLAVNHPVAAHPLARAEPSAPAPAHMRTPARTLPRTGLAGTGWPAAIALLLLTGLALVALARVGGRR